MSGAVVYDSALEGESRSDESETHEFLVAQLQYHLREALALAGRLERSDWVRKIEQLKRGVAGGDRVRRGGGGTSMPLAPVGPPVELLQWVEDCIASLTTFRAEYMLAHEDDPAGFPTSRPAAEWFEEWGSRAPSPAAREPEDAEEGDVAEPHLSHHG